MRDNDLTSWIGHTDTCTDSLDALHAARVALSIGDDPAQLGPRLPLLWHWAFFVSGQPYDLLGHDGHPVQGGPLPPTAENRRRMWAGGRVQFHAPLRIGVPAERASVITSVTEKQGRTGTLTFVTAQHEYRQDGLVCIREEQDIVYRAPAAPRLQGTQPAPESAWRQTIQPDPVMLFRYSAVTFNGHRIHYDLPYARDVEGYPGLVVHGPLIATLMVRAFKQANPDTTIRSLSYQGLRPLIAPSAFEVGGRLLDDGKAHLWAAQDGTLAHQGEIGF